MKNIMGFHLLVIQLFYFSQTEIIAVIVIILVKEPLKTPPPKGSGFWLSQPYGIVFTGVVDTADDVFIGLRLRSFGLSRFCWLSNRLAAERLLIESLRGVVVLAVFRFTRIDDASAAASSFSLALQKLNH